MINTSFRLAPWADVLYACDWKWWETYGKEAARTHIRELWAADDKARDTFGISWVRGVDGRGLCAREDAIHTGRNSGYQAIGLAALFGAARIVLLGYDMQKTRGRNHWHADHPERLGNLGNLDGWRALMAKLSTDLAAAGVDVINASRATALTCFRRADLEEALS